MDRPPALAFGFWAACAFVVAAGLALLAKPPHATAQAAAALSLVLAVVAASGGGRVAWLLAAALLGVGRAGPGPPASVLPGAPVALTGRLLEAWPGERSGWEGVLNEVGVPRRSQLSHPPKTVRLQAIDPPQAPPLGSRIVVEGLLAGTARWPRLERAGVLTPGRAAGGAARQQTGVAGTPGWRAWVRQRFHAALPPAEAGIACALVLGESHAVPGDRWTAYRRLGLLHLLAISGLHVWLWDAWLRRLAPTRCQWLRWPALIALGATAGLRAPVVRALAAIALHDLQAKRGRRVATPMLWAAALFVEVAWIAPRPVGWGLVLSYSATLGLVLAKPPAHAARWRQWLQPSCAAFLATAPWLHAWHGTLEPWSILLTPVFALLLPWRLTAAWLSLIPGFDVPVAWALAQLGGLETAAMGFVSQLPAAPLAAPQWPSLCITVLALAWGAWLLGAWRARWATATTALALAVATALPARPGIQVLPVGHGLCAIVGGTERTLLFDLGSADLEPARLIDEHLLPALRARRWRLPDRIVLSHADADHRNALPEFARRHPIQVIDTPSGQSLTLEGLAPFEVTLHGLDQAAPGANAGGQVLEVRAGGQRAILLGDPFGWSIRKLLERLQPGPIDLLLAPHHGRTTDGLTELLQHLQPRRVWVAASETDGPLAAAAILDASGAHWRSTADGRLDLSLSSAAEAEPAASDRRHH